MASDKMRESFTTGIGVLDYPHINKPKTQGKFPTGQFHANLILEGEALESITARVDAFGEKAFGKKWAVLREMKEYSPLKPNKNGDVYLANKSKDRPRVADVKGTLIPFKYMPNIGNGTKARLNVTLNKWEKGVNCYVNGVQIIELVEYTGGNAKFEDASDAGGAEGYTYEGGDDSGFADAEESNESTPTKASAF